MKVQFKYAFLTGILSVRGVTFGIVAGMMLVFIVLGTLFNLPEAALITAVSLGGTGIAAMVVVNIINDYTITRRMLAAPGAYLYTLVPAHRGKMLFASLITMLILDISTLAIVIWGETWMSLLLAGEHATQSIMDVLRQDPATINGILWGALMFVSGYLLVMMVIMFCETIDKSVFYQKRASSLLTALIACACIYVIHLLPLLLAPFGGVSIDGAFIKIIVISLDGWTLYAYAILHLLAAAGLFIPTAKLMERKINI